jgi:uncharacterized protein
MLQLATILSFRGSDMGAEMIALARLGCDVPDEIDDAPVFAAIRGLLDAYDQLRSTRPDDRRRLGLLMMAATAARTPEIPVPG